MTGPREEQHARDRKRPAGAGPRKAVWPLVLGGALLVVAGVIGAGLYLMMTAQPIPGFVETGREYLFPEARQRVDAVRLVGIDTAGGRMTFRRDGRRDGPRWALAERDGYPADAGAVDGLVRRIVDLRTVYVSEGSNPDYARYGVNRDLKSRVSEPVRVTLRDAAGEAVARVIVGDTSRDPHGAHSDNTFVRRDGDARVWIARGELRVSPIPADWLQRRIVDIDRSRVVKIVMRPEDGDDLSVVRTEGGGLGIESGPISESDLDGPWALEALAAVLEAVEFEQVEPASRGRAVGGAEAGRARVLTAEGVGYIVRFSERETGVWAVFRAELRDPAADPGGRDSGEAQASGEAQESDGRRADRVAAFNRRHEGWVYRLPDYVAEILTRRPEDITRASQ